MLTHIGLWLKDSDRSRTSLPFFISIYTLAAMLEGSGMTAMLWYEIRCILTA